MITIQVQSDLHLDAQGAYETYKISAKSPYLALLGDIGRITKDYLGYTNFILTQLQQFKTVFLVMGNHEPYHSSWREAKLQMDAFQHDLHTRKQNEQDLGIFVVLDRTRFDIDDVEDAITVLGCTLFSKIPPESHNALSVGVKDFYHIRNWDIARHNKEHEGDLAWLNSEVHSLEASGRKVIIMTHYSPTWDVRAQDARHRGSKIGSGFATDLSTEKCWQSPVVKLWAFGHTHYNCNFVDALGKRIYTNQRGYHSRPSPGFDAEALIEI